MKQIRKIWEELTKEELGTPKANFKHDGLVYTITGKSEKGNIMYSGGDPDAQFVDVLRVEWPIEEEKEEPNLYAPAIIQVKTGNWCQPQVTEQLFTSMERAQKYFDDGNDLSGRTGNNTVKVLLWPYGNPMELELFKD